MPHHKFLETEWFLGLRLGIIAQLLLEQKVDCVRMVHLASDGLLQPQTNVDRPPGPITRVGHLNNKPALVALLHQLKVQLTEKFVGLSLSNCVALCNTIEFFKKHALKRLCSKMKQDRPCFGDRLLIDIYEVQLVYIAVHQKMFILFVHLRQFLVSKLQVLVVLLVL